MGILNGKHALITGASSGIGFSVARRFLEEGACVGAHFHTNGTMAERLVAMADAGQCATFMADFSHRCEVLNLWSAFIRWSGTIDILVNNAGAVIGPAPIDGITDVAWDSTFAINLTAPFLLSRAALAVMKKKLSGRIISISSVGVKFGGSPETAHYSASKAALEAISSSFVKAAAPYNVLVNIIRAGVTDTSFHQKIGRSASGLAARAQLIPLKRLAKAEEIAEAVVFLASEGSSYITGAVLTVAGGE